MLKTIGIAIISLVAIYLVVRSAVEDALRNYFEKNENMKVGKKIQ